MRSIFIIILQLAFVCNCFALTKTPPEPSSNDELTIGSYNIKWIGNTWHDFEKLAKVIQHFDICGIVEIKKERSLEQLTKKLEDLTGEDWGYIYGYRTHRPGGNYHEAYGFIWKRSKVQLGDGVISNIWDKQEEFRNDPFSATFIKNKNQFILTLIHTRWTNDSDGTRANEVAAIARHINDMQNYIDEEDHFLMGDFNYSATSKK